MLPSYPRAALAPITTRRCVGLPAHPHCSTALVSAMPSAPAQFSHYLSLSKVGLRARREWGLSCGHGAGVARHRDSAGCGAGTEGWDGAGGSQPRGLAALALRGRFPGRDGSAPLSRRVTRTPRLRLTRWHSPTPRPSIPRPPRTASPQSTRRRTPTPRRTIRGKAQYRSTP